MISRIQSRKWFTIPLLAALFYWSIGAHVFHPLVHNHWGVQQGHWNHFNQPDYVSQFGNRAGLSYHPYQAYFSHYSRLFNQATHSCGHAHQHPFAPLPNGHEDGEEKTEASCLICDFLASSSLITPGIPQNVVPAQSGFVARLIALTWTIQAEQQQFHIRGPPGTCSFVV